MSNADLQTISLFKGLAPRALEEVERAASMHQLESDGYFFQQGDPATRLYVVTKGQVRLTQLTSEGQQVILRYASAGEAIGVIAVLSDSVYPASAQSVEETQAISWGAREMEFLMEKHPRLAINAIRILSKRVQEFQDRLRELATERVERRVARVLLRLANQTGRKTPEGVLIDMPLTRQDLAEMTGTTLYSVSRILSQWESQGLVLSKREQVTLKFPHGLVAIADDLPRPARPKSKGEE